MKQQLVNQQKQSQMMSQGQIQLMTFLQMSNQELDTWLNEQYHENPFLEKEICATISLENRASSEWKEPVVFDRQGVEYDLLEQLCPVDFSDSEWEMIRFFIANVDAKGYFTMDLKALAQKSRISLAVLEKCLNVLRELEPAGIFSANMQQCLVKQLDKRNIQDELLVKIISENLEDLLYKKSGKIQKKYNISQRKINMYYELLAGLNPYPLYGQGKTNTHYLVPDIICSNKDGKMTAELYKGNTSYSICDDYYNMMKETLDEKLKLYFKEKYQAAQSILKNIEKRERTILQITEVILEKQEAFFRKKGILNPMTMKEIAQVCNISISTVSRTVNNKYIQYPYGMIRMRELFIAAANMGEFDNNVISTENVKQIIADMIKRENPQKPLSDEEISNRLRKQSIQLSRRAVAKYRSEMLIPTSRERKVNGD